MPTRKRAGQQGVKTFMRKTFTAVHLLLVFFPLIVQAQERIVVRAPTPFIEDGKAVSLEVVIYKPQGIGSFPTLVFNHGSTGNGDDPTSFAKTHTSETVAKFFNDRSWLVAFPQRRGRGQSDGIYDEGFETNRSRYSCSPALSLPGVDRALEDIDAAVVYLKSRTDVDLSRMLIGGQSRGGILSIAYVGTRPEIFVGAINFVGGWMSDRCPNPEAINTVTFQRGAGFSRSTLWLYGENDRFYRIGHSSSNFNAFITSGGLGTFEVYNLGEGKNGNFLFAFPDLWREAVDSYLLSLKDTDVKLKNFNSTLQPDIASDIR